MQNFLEVLNYWRRKMEWIDTLTQLIGTIGFPIVAAGAMFWKVNKQDEQHKSEMDNVTKAIENNTNAITALTEKLSK